MAQGDRFWGYLCDQAQAGLERNRIALEMAHDTEQCPENMLYPVPLSLSEDPTKVLFGFSTVSGDASEAWQLLSCCVGEENLRSFDLPELPWLENLAHENFCVLELRCVPRYA
eukprot:m.922711 g.922711  ORF g.922711 m.922711 type:complete len:113 (-) comp101898_c0_seq1:75-413(-)